MRRLLLAFTFLAATAASAQAPWRFAVAGDSRNCGDVVMPAMAAAVKADQAAFYWHLGDFRLMTGVDEDMAKAASKPYTITAYYNAAFSDFIKNEIDPFAPLPVYLGIGNHDVVRFSRAEFVAQFGDWLTQAPIVRQRLADNPDDHMVRPYYHWLQGGVDFITLDNASYEFDAAQMTWIRRLLDRDAADPNVKALVFGMHAALPHSLGCDHSMNQTAAGEWSGSVVYRQLLDFRQKTKKNVYLIASHSHFLITDVYDSPYWRAHGGVLPGVIIGTAGAVRYRLPDTAQGLPRERARTNVYGYLLGTVDPATGSIAFEFRTVERSAATPDVVQRYGTEFVDWCWAENRSLAVTSSAPCAAADAPSGPIPQP